jgi:DNA-binding SARP family transcriptional activator
MDAEPGLGRLFIAHRQAARLTQQQLAARARVSVGTIRDLEQGRTATVRSQTLTRLAGALSLGQREREQLTSAAGSVSATRRPSSGQPPAWAGTEPGLVLALLGPLVAWRDGASLELGPTRLQAVLALLALHNGTTVSRQAIGEALWGNDPPPTASQMLQGYVSRIRRLLGPAERTGDRAGHGPAAPLLWDGVGYRLAPGTVRTDADRFSVLAGLAGRTASAGDQAGARRLYEQAVRLWRGAPVSGLPALSDHPSVVRLAAQRAQVVIEYFDVAASPSHYKQVAGHLQALTADELLDERIHARLMIALSATGQQAAALRRYEQLRRRLDDELGVSPGPELARAYLMVLRQEAKLGRRAVGTIGGRTAAGEPANAAEPAADWVTPRQLPLATPYFAGRVSELRALDRMLGQLSEAGRTSMIAIISGTAGVGKTALALNWAHGVAAQFPDGQLHADLRGYGPSGPPVTAAEAIGTLLEGLGVPAERIPVGFAARVGLYRSLLAMKRMLIVFDGVRSADQVRPLLPAGPGCLVLVTSRGQLTGLAVEGATTLALGVLSEHEAHLVLARRIGGRRVAAEPWAADDLVRFCGRLPLALGVVAARAAAHPRSPLAVIADGLRDEGQRMDALGTGDPATDVRAVFSWSAGLLSQGAAQLFCLTGIYAGRDLTVPVTASLAAIPRPRAFQLLTELSRSGLLTEHLPGRFAAHDLLRAYAAEQARAHLSETGEQAALLRVLDYFLLSFDAAGRLIDGWRDPVALVASGTEVIPESFDSLAAASAWCLSEAGDLARVIGQAAARGFSGHAWQLAWAADAFFNRLARWEETVAVHRIALSAAERQHDLTGEAYLRSGLGRALVMLRAEDEARQCLQRAITVFQQIGDRVGEAVARSRRALLSDWESEPGQAYGQAEQTLELCRGTGNVAGQAVALNSLGYHASQLGEYERALKFFDQALHVFRDLDDRRGQGVVHSSIAAAYLELGDSSLSRDHARAATESLDPTGYVWELAWALDMLGNACGASGDHDAARAAWQRALDLLDPLQSIGERATSMIRDKIGAD